MPGPVVATRDGVAFRVPEREDVAFIQQSSTDPRIRFPLGSYRHRNREQQRDMFEGRVENDSEASFVVCLADSAVDGAANGDETNGDETNGDEADSEEADSAADSEVNRNHANGDEADDDPERIGWVGVHNVDGDRAWLSYWLLPEYHGEGYGRATAEFAVDYAFETHAVHGVSAGAYDFNEASRGLLESLGFKADVCQVERDYMNGEYQDSYTYSLLRREWERQRGDA